MRERRVALSLVVAVVCTGAAAPGTSADDEAHPHHHGEAAGGTPTDKSVFWLEGEWTNEKGESVTLRSFEGKPVVLLMLYTHCESACPILIEDAKRISRSLTEKERSRVRFVIVTVDPERDTPARLSEFKKKNGSAVKTWVFLTGPPAQTLELEALLGIQIRRMGEKDFAHSNKISVLNAKGEIVHQSEGLHTPPAETLSAIRGSLNLP
ncbi:MAG: SCO family protein [Nitrospirae bacterium]|nr:SCO family protein [Nitrospirota bacterium]